MNVEDELRAALRRQAESSPDGLGLDPAAVVDRSRARRRPKRVLVSSAMALVAVGVLAITVPFALRPVSTVADLESAPSSQEAASSESSAPDEAMPVEADAMSCGMPLPPFGSSLTAVEARFTAPAMTAVPSSAAIEATIVLTSVVAEPLVMEVVGAPRIVVGADGRIATLPAVAPVGTGSFELGPGESVELPVGAVLAACDPDAAPSGPVEVVVVLDVALRSSEGEPIGSDSVVIGAGGG